MIYKAKVFGPADGFADIVTVTAGAADSGLIEAAPVLLSALRRAERRFPYLVASGLSADLQETIADVRAAIAKATGEEAQ